MDLFTTRDLPIEENIEKLAKLPLRYEPGEKFTYSEGLVFSGILMKQTQGPVNDETRWKFRQMVFASITR